jgi:hypothetical protein
MHRNSAVKNQRCHKNAIKLSLAGTLFNKRYQIDTAHIERETMWAVSILSHFDFCQENTDWGISKIQNFSTSRRKIACSRLRSCGVLILCFPLALDGASHAPLPFAFHATF